jgi:hypothetical protein
VYERSRQLCLQVYQKPSLSPTAHLEAALRWGLALPPRNMMAFAALYSWRDRTARALDESVHYVMPKAALLELSRALPSTTGDVRKLLGKGSGLSGGASLLLSRAEEVAQVIVQSQQQQQQQQPATTAGAGTGAADGSVQPPAAAAAAEVKPKQLPALVPRKVAAPAVRAVKPAAAGASGMRGLFGKAGYSSAAAVQQQRGAPKQPSQQPNTLQQQALDPSATPATQLQLPHEQLPQRQLPQQAAPSAPHSNMSSSGGSMLAGKTIAPARKGGGSVGGLFARKLQPSAPSAATGSKHGRFKVDFLLPAADTAAAAVAQSPAEAGAETASAAAAASSQGPDCTAELQAGQGGEVQRVSSAAVRAVVDQLMASGDHAEEAIATDEAAAAAAAGSSLAAAATAADGGGSGQGSDGEDGFGEFVPLSQQGPKGKHKRKAAAAALLAAEAAAKAQVANGSKRQRVEQQQGSPRRKCKVSFRSS